MKKQLPLPITFAIVACLCSFIIAPVKKDKTLKVVIIRHGEKPKHGDNLSCQGLNRALQLPPVLFAKYGVPDYTYIPSVSGGTSTTHSRMFQTVTPFAVRYGLTLNSNFPEKDAAGVAADVKTKTGTVLMVWEHSNIPAIAKALGIKDPGGWASTFDSIWIVTIVKGVPTLSKDIEGLHPSANCQ